MDAQMLNEALIRQYPSPQSATESLDQHSILILLFELQRNGINHDSVLDALENKNLSPGDHAIIAFIDKTLVTPIGSAELGAPNSSKLKGVAIAAMRIALSDGILAMTKGPIIPIADSLLALTFGLSDLQGKPYKTLENKFLEALQSLHLATENLVSDQEMIGARNRLLELLEADIIGFVSHERDKTKNFERRLVDSFSTQIKEKTIDDRIAPRLNIDATIFIEAGIRAQPKDTGKIVICSSHDISETGMQVVLVKDISDDRLFQG